MKETEDLLNKNYNLLNREIEEDISRLKNLPHS
jgi:hypothetical protein